MDALSTLRCELTPLGIETHRVHQLSTFLMFAAPMEELATAASWPGSSPAARATLLERLQTFLPAEVMLPPHRLQVCIRYLWHGAFAHTQTLLRQAVEYQYGQCALHNGRPSSATGDILMDDAHALLVDHTCNMAQFPCVTRQILTDHCDEVWCAQFSHNGRYLATGSKESIVYVYEVDSVSVRCVCAHRSTNS